MALQYFRCQPQLTQQLAQARSIAAERLGLMFTTDPVAGQTHIDGTCPQGYRIFDGLDINGVARSF